MERPAEPPGTMKKAERTLKGRVYGVNGDLVTVDFNQLYLKERGAPVLSQAVLLWYHLFEHHDGEPKIYFRLKMLPKEGQEVRATLSDLERERQRIDTLEQMQAQSGKPLSNAPVEDLVN